MDDRQDLISMFSPRPDTDFQRLDADWKWRGPKVETAVDLARGEIFQKLVGETHAELIRTRNSQIREALIALGWTPPTE